MNEQPKKTAEEMYADLFLEHHELKHEHSRAKSELDRLRLNMASIMAENSQLRMDKDKLNEKRIEKRARQLAHKMVGYKRQPQYYFVDPDKSVKARAGRIYPKTEVGFWRRIFQ